MEYIEQHQSTPWEVHGDIHDHSRVTLSSLRLCFNPISSKLSIGRTVASLNKFEDRISAIYSHIFQTMMGNFTYMTDEYNAYGCKYPGVPVESVNITVRSHKFIPTLRTTLYNGTIFHVPETLTFHNPMTNIGFAVCDDLGISQFNLSELVDVFHTSVWLLTMSVCLMAAYTHPRLRSYNRKDKNQQPLIYQVMKVILEQGNPYSDQVLKSTQERYLASCILFLGIVISNSYKSSNIYRMTRSRPLKLYENFDQILNDGFILLTRATTLKLPVLNKNSIKTTDNKLTIDWETTRTWGYDTVNLSYTTEYPRISISYTSELLSYSDIQGTNLSASIGKVLYSSELHPLAGHELRRPINDIIRSNFTLRFPSRNEFLSNYYKREETLLVQRLRQCNRTAVLIPDVLAARYKRKFQTNSTNRNSIKTLKFGKQKFVSLVEGISFGGLLDSSFSKRLMSCLHSGVIDWWEKIMRLGIEKTRENEDQVSPATINGKLGIIFLVTIAGIALSCVAFCLEMLVHESFPRRKKLRIIW